MTLRDRWWLRKRKRARAADLGAELERVRALLDAGRAVNSAREPDEVLQTILDRAVALLHGTTGSVMLCEGDELVVVAASGNDAALHRRVKIGAAISGRVASVRRPEVVVGRATASHFPGIGERDDLAVDVAISVPMLDRLDLVGVLNVGVRGERQLTSGEVELLSAFAEHAATAIAKARLYEAARRATAELAYSATHDALTSLPNRALLADRIDVAMRDAGPEAHGALLFVDIDGFKEINDELGHAAGDAALCAVAARMRAIAPVGATPARVGGDELAIFLPEVRSAEDGEKIASALVDSASRPIPLDQGEAVVTVSVGVALVATHGCAYADLMAAADRALYEAKRAGKNCWRMSRPVPLTVAGDPHPRQRRRWSDVSGAGHGPR